MSRTSLILLVLAIVSIGGSYLCGTKSKEWETRRREQQTNPLGFSVFPNIPETEWNWWDAGSFGFLIIGGSCTIAAVWKRKG